MRNRLQFSFVAILVMVAFTAKAADIGFGASFPFLGELIASQKTTEVHAGLTLLVDTSETIDGPQKSVWTGGYISLPADTNGVFSEFRYLRVNALALGIKPEQIKERTIESDDPRTIAIDDDGSIRINTLALKPGQHSIVLSVKQNASRKDKRIFLIIRLAEHIVKTDQVAMVFMVTDPTRFVNSYLKRFEGSTIDNASADCLLLAKSLYLEKEAGSFRLVSPILTYNVLQEPVWRERQGLPKQLDPPVQAEPKVEVKELPALSGLADFTINIVNQDGTGCPATGMKMMLKAPNGSVRTFNVTDASPSFTGFESGDYQLKVIISGEKEMEWATVHIWPGMKPIRITLRRETK